VTSSLNKTFPPYDQIKDLIQLAMREDTGPVNDDVTSRLMVPADAVGVGTLLQKDVGVVCGLPIVEQICRAYDERLRVEMIPGFHMEIIEGRFSDQRVTPLTGCSSQSETELATVNTERGSEVGPSRKEPVRIMVMQGTAPAESQQGPSPGADAWVSAMTACEANKAWSGWAFARGSPQHSPSGEGVDASRVGTGRPRRAIAGVTIKAAWCRSSATS
jgi:hypothetical protein